MKINVMNSIERVLSMPQKKGRHATLLIGAACLSAGLGYLSAPKEIISEQHDEAAIQKFLSDWQVKMQKTMDEMSKKPLPALDLSAVSQEILALSKNFDAFRETQAKTLSDSLIHTQSALGQELTSIKEVVTHLDDKKEQVKYVPIESLPFSVVSIDSIQQVPVASISYDYKTIPLEKGDSLAGWKVVRVDYGKQRIELENGHHERALVTQEHIG